MFQPTLRRIAGLIVLAAALSSGVVHASSTASGTLCYSFGCDYSSVTVIAEPLMIRGLDMPISPDASVSILPDWQHFHSSQQEHDAGRRTSEARGWTRTDARHEVEEIYHAHRQHLHERDNVGHHMGSDDHHRTDDGDFDPPHPTPLPAAALLFAPALLLLRLFQRRAG